MGRPAARLAPQAALLLMLCCFASARTLEPVDDAPQPVGRALQQAEGAKTTADYIVVGAGLAGLAAAKRIADKVGKASVIVLEGRDRVGGRCYTRELPGPKGTKFKAEYGAGWIHGLKNNPIVALAKQAGVSLSAVTDYDNGVMYLPNGKEASAAQDQKWEDTYGDFEDFVEEQQGVLEEEGDRDPGMASLAAKFMKQEGLAGMDRLAFLTNLNTNLEHEFAGPLANLSAYVDYDTAVDDDDKFVTGGYQKLAEYLAKGMDVRLKHKVTAIDTSRSDRITLTTASRGTFTAKRIIVAVPLGVMQRNAIRFTPALPAVNRKALGQLGMGLLNKLVLVFDRAFWQGDEKVQVINRIDPNGAGAWQETYNMLPVTGTSALVAFNTANYAAKLEKRSDAAVKDEFMAVLRSIYGEEEVPEPISYAVTAWGRDEFAYGSYSYTKAPVKGEAGYRQAHRDCAKPTANNRLFFAGEHTRTDFPATTHGALLSGQAAGCDALKAAKKSC